MGTPARRVILFGTIPTTIPDTTPVIAVSTTKTPIIAPTIPPSPDYTPASFDYSPASETESDPSEDPSSGHIPPLPAISPFLSSNDDTTDRPGQPIPHGRPYRYHPNGPVHMMTVRKRVRPLPVQQLSVRHYVDHSSSDSSSRHSSSDHSSPNLLSTSAGPSRKRRRSPMTSVHALPLVSEALSPVRADLIPSPKRVRNIGYLADVDQRLRMRHWEIWFRGFIITHRLSQSIVYRLLRASREHGHRIVGVESAVTALTKRVAELGGITRGLEAPKMPNTRSRASMTHEEVEELVARRVAEEMEARKVARNLETLNENEEEQEGENGGNGGNRNGENRGNENGGNGENGENGNHGMNYEGNDLIAYTQKFQELILLYTRMVPDEEDIVERFIGGLPNNIQGNVIAGYAARSAENKRRMESNPRDNCGQKPPFKRQNTTRQNVARAYMVGNNERKGYVGSFPYCNKCKLHHKGLCTIRCRNFKKIGHQTRDYRVTVNPNTQGATVGNQQGIACYECGRPGHFRKDCFKLRNQNRGNQTRNKTRGNEVTSKAYVIGGGETNPDSNVVT
nr:hypothetical protein [Tanacetum cinerariifolium]